MLRASDNSPLPLKRRRRRCALAAGRALLERVAPPRRVVGRARAVVARDRELLGRRELGAQRDGHRVRRACRAAAAVGAERRDPDVARLDGRAEMVRERAVG